MRNRGKALRRPGLALLFALFAPPGAADYTNFESSHVHPLDLTPAGDRLLAVNTPDALLEIYTIEPDGSLSPLAAVPLVPWPGSSSGSSAAHEKRPSN